MASKHPSMKHRDVNRRASTAELIQARANRTSIEQLAILDARLGVGVGAVKERARLQKLIEGKKK